MGNEQITASMVWELNKLYNINLSEHKFSKISLFQCRANYNTCIWINSFSINSFEKFNGGVR